MTNQDLSKIDFGKCKLPEWCDFKLRAKLDMGRVTILSDGRHGDPRVAFRAVDGWAVSPGVDGHLLTELDQLKAIGAQVDTFIEAELAKLNAPEWVEVKWTEVERLRNAGVSMQYTDAIVTRAKRIDTGHGITGVTYYADLKTVPDGVALYEPDWVDVPWWDVEMLRKTGVGVEFKCGNEWRSMSVREPFGQLRYIQYGTKENRYLSDRKIFPPGFELTKAESVNQRRVSFVKRGELDLDGVKFTVKEVTEKFNVTLLELEKTEPAWLPCTRDEAEAHPGNSQLCSVKDGKRHGFWRPNVLNVLHGFDYEYRTRTKLDRWVAVPWGDADRLRADGSKIQFRRFNGCWANSTAAESRSEYRADRSTLPANYVLGVGFVEGEPVKTEKSQTVKLVSLSPVRGYTKESNLIGPDRFGLLLPCSIKGIKGEQEATVWFDVPRGLNTNDLIATDYEKTKVTLELAVK